jgi:diguanylate cyclase (GGDEF)-like protein
LAMSLRRSIRSVDTPARLGGDEFCVLAPHQDAKGAAILAERLAAAVREEVATPDDPPVSLSIGVVGCPEHGQDAETLVDVADRAMYRAKAAGESVAMGEPPEAEAEPVEESSNGSPEETTREDNLPRGSGGASPRLSFD